MTEVNYALILIASFIAVASPGPATLAIAGTSMAQGRLKGSVLATGITTGSLIWSCSAALGFSAIMYTNLWLFELMRYLGASYLLFMAYKSARAAFSQSPLLIKNAKEKSLAATYYRGVAIHLTNPKAIFFFAALYAVAFPADTQLIEILTVNGLIVLQGFIVFQTYAFLFSVPKVREFYLQMKRWFEAFFAMAFGFAGFKIFTLDID